KRPWPQVDLPLLSEADFKKAFPHDAYKDENQADTWKRKLIWAETIQTGEKKTEQSLPFSQPSGVYAIVASYLDPSGDSIRLSRYVYAFGERGFRKSGMPEVLKAWADKSSAQPGDQVKLRLATNQKRLWVRYILSQGADILEDKIIALKGNKQTEISIPITEEYRGGLDWSVSTIDFNEVHLSSGNIAVPWTNKQLQLSWSTFRSKLQPGQEEEWRLSIKGPQGEAVAAEMVASLYDASLDAFAPNQYQLSLFPTYLRRWSWSANQTFGIRSVNGGRDQAELKRLRNLPNPTRRRYDRLRIGGGFYTFTGALRDSYTAGGAVPGARSQIAFSASAEPMMAKAEAPDADGVEAEYDKLERDQTRVDEKTPSEESDEGVEKGPPLRTNLQETAFFFPQLRTDKNGEISLSFTMPEALTRWKFLGLAHTQDLQSGLLGGETLTQKELMVQPNLPRFLREGDTLRLIAKLSNLSEETLAGNAQLQILDARSMQPLNEAFRVAETQQSFSLAQDQNQTLAWQIIVPEAVSAVVIKMSAKSEKFSDGEENALPVLPNRMLVTETLPMSMLGSGQKDYTFKGLAQAAESATLSHQSLTLEFSSNPAWYAVQSFPYLMEYPYECTEQIFSRLYANTLAQHIANDNPRIKDIYQQWQQAAAQGDSRSFMSMLEQNQDLKTAILEETPWVRQANNESERKKRLGLLFDFNRMANESAKARRQLEERQLSDGSFSWFPGMRGSRYITQLVMTGIGKLQKMGVSGFGNPEVGQMSQQAMRF
ncbi:MAG: alpha-2-macroglobulin family protein, partial [Bacteroidota bacterium]